MKENEKEKNVLNPISEQELENVAGGEESIDRVPVLHLNNDSFYKSGDTPKYSIGQEVVITYRYKQQTLKLRCEIIGVTETRECGLIYKEFGYSIKLLESLPFFPKGTVRHNVYESCIYEN